jgi:cytochrome bd ubiquinol oxidase subunit II
LIGLFFVLKSKNELFPLIASSLIIIGGITSSLASMFPVILPSTNTINESLTIYNTAAERYGLSVAMYWGIVGFILLFVYMIIQKRLMKGKIDKMDYGH